MESDDALTCATDHGCSWTLGSLIIKWHKLVSILIHPFCPKITNVSRISTNLAAVFNVLERSCQVLALNNRTSSGSVREFYASKAARGLGLREFIALEQLSTNWRRPYMTKRAVQSHAPPYVGHSTRATSKGQ